MTRAQRSLVRGLVAGCAVYGAVATPHAAVLFGLAALALVPVRLRVPATAEVALFVLLGLGAFAWIWGTAPAGRSGFRLVPHWLLILGLLESVQRVLLMPEAPSEVEFRRGQVTVGLTMIPVAALGSVSAPTPYPWFLLAYVPIALGIVRLLDPNRSGPRALRARDRALFAVTVALAGAITVAAAWALPPLHGVAERYGAQLVGGPSGAFRSGFGRTIQLGEVRDIILSDETMLRLSGPHVDHLRGVVYRHYRRGVWAESIGDPRPVVRFEALGPETAASVTVERVGDESSRIFVPLSAHAIALPEAEARVDAVGVLSALDGQPWETVRFDVGPGRRPAVADPTEDDVALPEDIAAPMRTLAEQWTRGKAAGRPQVEALIARLDRDYRYSLQRAATPGVDPVLDFLTTNREGHCELFASSLALLARSLGVPARVAGGFRVTERNPWTEQWVVRGRNAHAWVEVYVDGAWATFDPTPAAGLAEHMPARTSGLGRIADTLGAALSRGGDFVRARTAVELAGLAAVFALWLFRRELAGLLRRRAPPDADPATFSTPPDYFARLTEVLEARGIERAPSETLEALAARLDQARELGPHGPEAATLVRRYCALRYGGADDAGRIAAAIEAWRRQLDALT